MLTICCEEKPTLFEVTFIMQRLGVPHGQIELRPTPGGFFVTGTSTPVTLRLVKKCGSFVDYVVYDHATPTPVSQPILLVEATKTSDSESRNTSVNQRFTKFAYARSLYPTCPMVLLYTTYQDHKTLTGVMGLRMLVTLGVEVYDVMRSLTDTLHPYMRIEEIIDEKNAMHRNSHNQSVVVTCVGEHSYTISAKLSKGTGTTLTHDPNVGYVTGLCLCMHSIDPLAKFTIVNHGVTDVGKATSKFWYANRTYHVTLEGFPNDTYKTPSPSQYWSYDTGSEKTATIHFHALMEARGYTTAFHNHSGSERSYLTLGGVKQSVPKSLRIPDIVLVDPTHTMLYVVEGKMFSTVDKGLQQMSEHVPFMRFLSDLFPNYTIRYGLCLYADTPSCPLTPYPMWYILNEDGSYAIHI